MSEEVEPVAQTTKIGAQPDRDARAFAELYAVHAAHVFDYCRALVGSDAAAASATRAALVSAPQLSMASHLVRASLISAARQEARTLATAESGWLGTQYTARFDTAQGVVGDTLRQLPAGHREVLALVYRYDVWPEQLAAVLGVPAADAYQRLAAAEHDFVTAATALRAAGPTSRSGGIDDPARPATARCPSLEDIGAAPLAIVPGSVWRDAVAELTAQTRQTAGLPRALSARHAAGSLALPRRRLRLTVAAAVPAVAVLCWAILAGAGSAHPVGAHDTGEPSAIGIAPRNSGSTATPASAGTGPAKQATAPVRPGAGPTIPVLALLPSTPAGTVLPVTTSTGTAADPASEASPSASTSSAAPSPSASTSSPAPSPSASTSSPAPSPSPSDSTSSASTSVPDPSPAS